MRIQAIKFVSGRSDVILQRYSLEVNSAQDLARFRDDTVPVVYLMSNEDLPALREFNDLIFDRGIKNRYKGLSEYLLKLNGDKIPIIDGNYNAHGQLKRSIREFLLRVLKKGKGNLYIIGAKKDIFDELWLRAQEPSKANTDKDSEWSGGFYPDMDEADETACRLMSDLIKECVRDEWGREKYERVRKEYVGQSWKIDFVRRLIVLAAKSDAPVLILGDTGTGKEIVAHQIHECGRKDKHFKALNCGGISATLFESELFGHKKGAFTDARYDKTGLWAEAKDGTLFLDEIGDLPMDQQVKILRVLATNTIRRLGETKETEVEARVLAATNRDLSSMVQRGQFREDLYYRLRGFLVHTPALKDHPNDIPLLAKHFWKEIIEGTEAADLPEDVLKKLKLYRWPGNAKELKMVLNNLFALRGTNRITARSLEDVFYIQGQNWSTRSGFIPDRGIDLIRGDCWRHLRRVDDVLRTLEYTLRPVMETKKNGKNVTAARTCLDFHLGELKLLCSEHMLFHSEKTFSTVVTFKEKLNYFHDLLHENVAKARKYWKETLTGEFKKVLSVIFKEGERVLGKG